MAIIGKFTKTEDGYTGSIETLTLKAKIDIKSVEKRSDNAPDYRVYHTTADYSSEIGAAWKKTSDSGTHYVSVRLDDPGFSVPLDCQLFKAGAEHTHNLVWERPRKKKS